MWRCTLTKTCFGRVIFFIFFSVCDKYVPTRVKLRRRGDGRRQNGARTRSIPLRTRSMAFFSTPFVVISSSNVSRERRGIRVYYIVTERRCMTIFWNRSRIERANTINGKTTKYRGSVFHAVSLIVREKEMEKKRTQYVLYFSRPLSSK